MSRVAKEPVELPQGVEFSQSGRTVSLKGSKGSLSLQLNSEIELVHDENTLMVKARSGSRFATAISGTTRALLANMVQGVTEGFEKKLQLVGIGYRVQFQGNKLNLTFGFSQPVDLTVPEGITSETPSQTEIVGKGMDKQLVGQGAAEIRGFRPAEPYKGKGVRYADERVVIKEAKKK